MEKLALVSCCQNPRSPPRNSLTSHSSCAGFAASVFSEQCSNHALCYTVMCGGEEVYFPKTLQSETFFGFSLQVGCSFEENACVLVILSGKHRMENNSQTFFSTLQTAI